MIKSLVTIMVPTYNHAAYLECAVESALAQDYANLEVIISDDCSSDETPEIAQKFKKENRLKYHRNNANSGKTENYRRLLYNLAEGEWVLNLDGDDYLTDNHYISFAMEQIKRYGNVVLFTAGVLESAERKQKHARLHQLVDRQICMEGTDLFFSWPRYKIPHLTTLYNRKKACSIGFYKEEIPSTDWESLLRLTFHGKVILSERIAGVWRKHGRNLSQSLTSSQFIENFAFITKPYEYALNKGIKKDLLDKWKQTMTRTIMKGQFNETWRNILSRQSRKEASQFVHSIWKNRPDFLIHFFRPVNIARFFLFILYIIWQPKRICHEDQYGNSLNKARGLK